LQSGGDNSLSIAIKIKTEEEKYMNAEKNYGNKQSPHRSLITTYSPANPSAIPFSFFLPP
jgi:hypothetical protein